MNVSLVRRFLPLGLLASLALSACGERQGGGAPAASSATAGAPGSAMLDGPKKAKEPSGLLFTAQPRAVGSKEEMKSNSEYRVKLRGKGPRGEPRDWEMSNVTSWVFRSEVIAVEAGAVTQAKVTYVEGKDVVDGKEQPTALVGKTFLLALSPGKLEVTDEKGKSAPANVADAVRTSRTFIDAPGTTLVAPPDKPVQIGDEVGSLAKMVGQLVEGKHEDGRVPSDVQVRLASIEKQGDDAIGVFSVKLTLATPKTSSSSLWVTTSLEGTLRVRARDGRLLALSLGGPVTLRDTKPGHETEGTGAQKWTFESTSP